MQFGSFDTRQQLVREGVAALQQGRASEARARFEAAIREGRNDSATWLLLALACRTGRDHVAEEQALDRLLALDPQSVRGLIMKGDCRAGAGDERVAVDFYKNALRIADGQTLSQADVSELRRIEQRARALDSKFAASLEQMLAEMGLGPGRRSARFEQSLDIMAGRKQVYYQAPTGYYFPGLAQTQFFDTSDFHWAPAVEGRTDSIRAELRALLADGLDGFRPYIRSGERAAETPSLARQERLERAFPVRERPQA